MGVFHASPVSKAAAQSKVAAAVTAKRIPPARDCTCVGCGAPAREYHHHRGYDKAHALDVVALCIKCHRQIHAADRRAEIAQRAAQRVTQSAQNCAEVEGEHTPAHERTVGGLLVRLGEQDEKTLTLVAQMYGVTLPVAIRIMAEYFLLERPVVEVRFAPKAAEAG